MRQDNPKPAIQRDGNQFRIRNYTSAGRRYRCQRLMRVCPIKSFAKRVQTGTPRAAKAPPRIEKNTVVKKALRDALDERGYDTLTPVQEAVTDPDLLGKDMLVSAQTGSGKTLGFGLVIAPTMLGEAETFDRAGAPLALVIAPDRSARFLRESRLSSSARRSPKRFSARLSFMLSTISPPALGSNGL